MLLREYRAATHSKTEWLQQIKHKKSSNSNYLWSQRQVDSKLSVCNESQHLCLPPCSRKSVKQHPKLSLSLTILQSLFKQLQVQDVSVCERQCRCMPNIVVATHLQYHLIWKQIAFCNYCLSLQVGKTLDKTHQKSALGTAQCESSLWSFANLASELCFIFDLLAH